MITLPVKVTMKINFKILLGHFSAYIMIQAIQSKLGICFHCSYPLCFVIFLDKLTIEM